MIKEERTTTVVEEDDGTGRVWYPARYVNGVMIRGYWGDRQYPRSNVNGTQLGKPFRVRGQMVPKDPIPSMRRWNRGRRVPHRAPDTEPNISPADEFKIGWDDDKEEFEVDWDDDVGPIKPEDQKPKSTPAEKYKKGWREAEPPPNET